MGWHMNIDCLSSRSRRYINSMGGRGHQGGREDYLQGITRSPGGTLGAWGRAWVGQGTYRHQVGHQGYRIAGYVPGRTGTGASVSTNGFRLSLLRAPFRSPPQGKIRFPKQRHCCASSCICYIAHRFIGGAYGCNTKCITYILSTIRWFSMVDGVWVSVFLLA